MRELLETLRNTDTGMYIIPCELGIKVGFVHTDDYELGAKVEFVHMNAGGPKRYEFIIGDIGLGALEISMEEYILSKLEWFLERLGIQMHA